ncbi:MAG: protein O-mannosyl-transferase family [Anaerolineae bacterium]
MAGPSLPAPDGRGLATVKGVWGRLRVWEGWPALASGLVALSLYGFTAAPSFTWAHDSADGGELLAAARTLGIAHPPGYPTYLLLLHLWTRLPLPGDLARRGNCFSALCAALAVALFADLAARERRREGSARPRLEAFLGGVLAAATPTLWGQATVTEVYALHLLFFAALWWLLWRGEGERRGRWLLSAGLALGLGLGNHLSLALALPGAAVWLLWQREGRGKALGAFAGGLALGLLVYLYLPLRARAWPPVNWGNPQTWEGFQWLVSGALYQRFVFGLSGAYLLPRLGAWAALLREQFGWVGLALGWMGLWAEGSQGRWRRLAFLGSAFVFYTAYAVGYDTTDSYVYLLPAHLILAWWVVRGLGTLAPAAEGGLVEGARPAVARALRWGGMAALAASVACRAALAFPQMDLREDWEAWQYGQEILAEAPPGALVLAVGDRQVFTLWYFRYGVRERPDLAVVTPNLWPYGWYRETVRRTHPDLAPGSDPLPEDLGGLVREVLATGRPVVATEEAVRDLAALRAYHPFKKAGSSLYELRQP